MEKIDKLNLIMVVHSHQPTGNFDQVFEEAFIRAYLPFLEALEKHPKIRVGLHYSGSLIDWIEKYKPEFIRRLTNLIKSSQIELLIGGYYEPILSLLPDEDKIGQIKLLSDKIYDLFGLRAQGAWLTERVWEPGISKVLNEADIKYTVVDDTHFEKIGRNAEDIYGYYISEEEGKTVNIFPGSKFLRYSLPFKMVDETIKYLKDFHGMGKNAITFADDGEKFGFWPHTYKWVYQERWLDNFFSALEDNLNWIETITPGEYSRLFPATGRIYLTCASYSEMLEWSDGYFKNFLVKYPEANSMHKRMLQVSKAIRNKKNKTKSAKLSEATRYLYMGQSNDSYWHGVFGGLYLNHLRYNVYSNLIKAENILSLLSTAKEDNQKIELLDFDCDGQEELILENSKIKIYIDPKDSASIFELDYKDKALNLINTLARRKEKYHEKIRQGLLKNERVASGPSSIHNSQKDIPQGLEKFLLYDKHRRSCLREYFIGDADIGLDSFSLGNFLDDSSNNIAYKIDSTKNVSGELTAIMKRNFDLNKLPFWAEKTISLGAGIPKLSYKYAVTNNSGNIWNGRIAMEFNFSLWDELLISKGERNSADSLTIKDSWFGIEINFAFDKTADIWHFPIETVYESEKGFEKNFQSLCIVFTWNLNLAPGKYWDVFITQDIKN